MVSDITDDSPCPVCLLPAYEHPNSFCEHPTREAVLRDLEFHDAKEKEQHEL